MSTTSTPAVHTATLCARSPAPAESTSRPLIPSLDLSVVYCLDDLDHVDALYEGDSSGFIYARDGHPNAAQLAGKLAKLEAAEAGLICASGMGAIAATFLSLLGQGDHALVSDGIYGRTIALVKHQLSRWGIGHSIFDPTDPASAKALLTSNTRLIFVETITNPLLRVADLAGLASVGREAGIPLVVDNTFAPAICRPMEHGASLVVHSVTKMIGGHSDLTLGAIVGDRRPVDEARTVASTLGQTGNPFESWLALRGLATLSLRMERSCATALELANRFELHPQVARVYYPMLASHPDFDRAPALLGAVGGTIVTIDLQARARAEAFIRALAGSIPFAPSLGDVQTTLSHPATTSHRGQDDAMLSRQGLSAGTVRVSVGLEEPEELWREFLGALEILDRT
ncbi:MAG: trans-sulfuration enzyme family protein [Isosphaeraceae bacterium]